MKTQSEILTLDKIVYLMHSVQTVEAPLRAVVPCSGGELGHV